MVITFLIRYETLLIIYILDMLPFLMSLKQSAVLLLKGRRYTHRLRQENCKGDQEHHSCNTGYVQPAMEPWCSWE